MPPKRSKETVERTCRTCGASFRVLASSLRHRGCDYCDRACFRARPVEDRFWEKVRRSEGCWEWQGAKGDGGYGRFQNGRGAVVPAHRYSWELVNGPMPAEFFACHSCDNPSCVRPDHIFPGTNRDNMRDMREKHRFPTGLAHPNAKLSDAEVERVRHFVPQRRGDLAQLARTLGVSPALVTQIRRGRARAGH